MIILEKPYVSERLVQCILEKQLPVLRNPMAEKLAEEGHALPLYDDKAFIAAYRQRRRLYTMSENALGWVAEHLPDPELLQHINQLKNKADFRRLCRQMYPDFFFLETDVEQLRSLNPSELPFPLVLKPSVGFLSAGVHVVRDAAEWQKAVEDLSGQALASGQGFPEFVLNMRKILIEAYIKGEEYAVDAYFDEEGKPVILNIFHHRFASESDTSDRLYCSSRKLYDRYEAPFTDFLIRTNQALSLRNFPIHIEFRYDGKQAVPIEINPLRFAGFCLNELQTHISGVHPVAAYFEGIRLSKEAMWKGKENDTYSFLVLERPADCADTAVFNGEKFRKDFTEVLEIREVEERSAGVAATVFLRTDTAHKSGLDRILHLDMHDYMR